MKSKKGFQSDIQALAGLKAANDAAKRFINLVDELYEKNVNFIASSAFDIAQYYTGKRLSELFKRTESRLLEMLTTNYISRPHLGFKADD